MSAGQTARRSLRAGRVRIALGVTGAAAALAVGGSFTAHADNSAPAPKPVPAKSTPADQCPEPVEAVPGEGAVPVKGDQVSYTTLSGDAVDAVPDGIAGPYKGKQVSYTLLGDDPVDAVPGDDCTAPDPSKGTPVDAVPGGKDTAPDHSARDAKPAPAKR
ncbi:hypothetical protein [Streptomyces sp. N50]|uniref:hypothetical protein n=1 Tax=Streptomyces sp. N50 TaxID=3081765 RepID=UPI0029623E13|nr:hypothetical protein [Streptomyces sp. N50]WOX14949.1 hypothetical protein R2B38_41610 [Streptomyces sp. N50]